MSTKVAFNQQNDMNRVYDAIVALLALSDQVKDLMQVPPETDPADLDQRIGGALSTLQDLQYQMMERMQPSFLVERHLSYREMGNLCQKLEGLPRLLSSNPGQEWIIEDLVQQVKTGLRTFDPQPVAGVRANHEGLCLSAAPS